MLGHKLVQVLSKKNEVWTTLRGSYSEYEKFQIFNKSRTVEKINVQDIKAVEETIEKIRPDVIIQLSQLSDKFEFRLITISTDCVFNGKKGNYVESDTPDAYDLYGKSKQLGEVEAERCLTLRTSIIGRELCTAHSLVEWFLRNEENAVRGFKNAIFSGFPTIILAEIIADTIENQPQLNGLYHISSAPINKYNLLNLLKQFYKKNIKIEPFEDFEIDRSLNSNKYRDATGFAPLEWSKMIKRMSDDNAIYTI